MTPTLLTDTLPIPDSVTTPCATFRTVFTDPALDPDPTVWANLPAAERHNVAAAKQSAEDRALQLCAQCPILEACHDWANTVTVFGVVGGTRNSERGPADVVDRYIASRETPTRDELVAIWLEENKTVTWISERLGISLNVVTRIRNRLQTATPEGNIRWGTMSDTTAAMYTLVADAVDVYPKNDLIAILLSNVSDKDALRNAPDGRAYASSKAKLLTGAKRYVRNLLRIAIRDGHIVEHETVEGIKTLTMKPETAARWRMWKENQLTSTV